MHTPPARPRRAALLLALLLVVLGALPLAKPTQAQSTEIVVAEDDEVSAERIGAVSSFYDAPAGSTTAGGHAYWTYSNSNTQPDNAIKYKPPLTSCGNWEVFAYIPYVNNYKSDSNKVPFTIVHLGGQRTVWVDQAIFASKPASDRWYSLGTYPFSLAASGAGEYVLIGDNTDEGNSATGVGQRSVTMDDVKWVNRGSNDAQCNRVGTPGDIIVAENGQNVERGGAAASFYDSPGGSTVYGGHAYWTWSNNFAQPDNFIKYKPNLPACGNWEVAAYIPYVNNSKPDSNKVPYTIKYLGNQGVITVDQGSFANAANRWHVLGTFPFSPSGNEYVQIGDNTGEGNPQTNVAGQRSVTMDDVRWSYRGTSAACGDATLPDGRLVEPSDRAKIGPGAVSFTAEASDNAGGSGVARVDFYINYNGQWQRVGVDSDAPYGITWSTPANLLSQRLIFTIHVIDGAGNDRADPGGYHYVDFSAPPVATAVQKPPPPPPTPCGVPFFWQADDRWKAQQMGGTCTCNIVQPCGCALTSGAMVLRYYGMEIDPGSLNVRMGRSACPFDWNVASKVTNGKATLVAARLPFSWQRLDQELNQNHRPVILYMMRGSTSHFVVVTGGNGTNPANYTINDPGMPGGQGLKLNTRTGWNFAELNIYQGTPACSLTNIAAVTNTAQHSKPGRTGTSSHPAKLVESTPVISGTALVYDTTDITMTVELEVPNSDPVTTEMLVWTDDAQSNTWQPFSDYIEVPVSEQVHVRFRDEAGNESDVADAARFTGSIADEDANAPEPTPQPTPDTPSVQQSSLYLPLAMR